VVAMMAVSVGGNVLVGMTGSGRRGRVAGVMARKVVVGGQGRCSRSRRVRTATSRRLRMALLAALTLLIAGLKIGDQSRQIPRNTPL